MRGLIAAALAFGALVAGAGSPAAAGTDRAVWSGAVSRLVTSHQSYPRSAELRHEQGTTRLRVAVATDGRIAQVDIIQSSGSAILDLQARSTITTIGKLPTPPVGISSIVIPIVWRLD